MLKKHTKKARTLVGQHHTLEEYRKYVQTKLSNVLITKIETRVN